MRVLNALGVVGICVLLALSAEAEKIKKPALYTRYGAAKAVFSCALEKEFEFELREEDQDRVGPVLQSLLHWVKEQGTREWMKHRLSRFDDESLARLSQDCGAMAESELRKTLRLPGRRDGEKALKVTFGPRNANTVRLAAASSGGRSLINRSHPEVSERMFFKKLGRGLKKLGKTIVTVIRKPRLIIDLIKPKRMRTSEIEAAWYRRYDFNPNGPGLLLLGISGFKMPGQAIKLKRIKEKAVGTTKQQYGKFSSIFLPPIPGPPAPFPSPSHPPSTTEKQLASPSDRLAFSTKIMTRYPVPPCNLVHLLDHRPQRDKRRVRCVSTHLLQLPCCEGIGWT